jgi:hypothetical protein
LPITPYNGGPPEKVHAAAVTIVAMQFTTPVPVEAASDSADRRPTLIDVFAGLLLAAAVVLHVVAMIPHFVESGSPKQSLLSQPDQAALYSILAAAWAGVLVIGLLGPKRLTMCAAAAVGVALTELGFRVADLGWYFRYGSAEQGPGLWIMTAAWAAGALGAAAVLVAAHRRRAPAPVIPAPPDPYRGATGSDWILDWPPPPREVTSASAVSSVSSGPDDTLEVGSIQPNDPTLAVALPDATAGSPVWPAPGSGDTMALASIPDEDPSRRTAWTLGVILLALAIAGFFLPAWDHYDWVSTSGRSGGFSLGNAFSNPWQVTIGNVICAVMLAAVPIVAIRLHNRPAAAALAIGGLAVMASQFVGAVIQVDQPTPAAISTPGVEFTVRLTAWFTLDVLAAFLLLAAFLVHATLRGAHENSPETLPNAPDFRSRSIPWPS